MSQPQSDQRISDDTPAQQETTTSPLVAAKALLVHTVQAPVWLLITLMVVFGLIGMGAGAKLASNDEPVAVSQQAPVASAPDLVVSTPDPAWTSPIKQIGGVTYDQSGTHKSYGLTYECEAGLTPVQLSSGQMVQTDGTTFSLKESRSASWGSQGVLTLSVKLNATTAVRGIIVTPAAHVKHPGLYNEYRIDADFGFGTAASQEFQPNTYSQNYENLGINTLTLCTQKMKK